MARTPLFCAAHNLSPCPDCYSPPPAVAFVVTSCPLHGITTVEGVFSTAERASTFVRGFHESNNMNVEPCTVDSSVSPVDSVVTHVDHAKGIITFTPSQPQNRQPCGTCRGYIDTKAKTSWHELGCWMLEPSVADLKASLALIRQRFEAVDRGWPISVDEWRGLAAFVKLRTTSPTPPEKL